MRYLWQSEIIGGLRSVTAGHRSNCKKAGTDYNYYIRMAGRISCVNAEHYFQKAAKLTLEFENEDDIKVHVWKNYPKRGGK